MAGILPVPRGRVSNALIQQRIVSQLQRQQRELLTVQTQISTGQRLTSPSDDPVAASRGITLQRVLEFNSQLQVNVRTSQAFMDATDTALASATEIVQNIRALTVSLVNATTDSTQRQAGAVEIEATLEQLVRLGNSQYQGRYLFAGSTTDVLPYRFDQHSVTYVGNEQHVQSYADREMLVGTNLTGQEVFGGLSAAVRGSTDLSPAVTLDTPLAALNQGLGVAPGTVTIFDGTSESRVDLSHAATLGDVVKALQASPPSGRTLEVRLGPQGLTLQLDAAGGGSLRVDSDPGSSTAEDLGIQGFSGTTSQTLIGTPLNPLLRLTTPVTELGGTRAEAVVESAGSDNDLLIRALRRGTEFNDVTVQFVDDQLLQAAPGLTQGNERVEFDSNPRAASASLAFSGLGNDLILRSTRPGEGDNQIRIEVTTADLGGDAANVSFDGGSRTLRIQVDAFNRTTVSTVVTAIDTQGRFTAVPDDSAGETYNPTATISAADAGVVEGNTGNSGGGPNTLYVAIEVGATTAQGVVEAFLRTPEIATQFQASLDPLDSDHVPPLGNGLTDVNARAVLSGGSGVEPDLGSGIQIANLDQTFEVTFEGATTLEDLINRINASEASVLATLNETQTGIDVRSTVSGYDFAIGELGGTTARDLGIRTFTEDTRLTTLNRAAGVRNDPGVDFEIVRNDGQILGIDIASAQTVGDVLNLINNHPDNLDGSLAVQARLATVGNGIELVNDNPSATGTLTVRRVGAGQAAVDLGLIDIHGDQQSLEPLRASLTIQASPANQLNTALRIQSALPGSNYNGVQVRVVNNLASGNQAFTSFDAAEGILTIDIDPASTTTNTIVAAVAGTNGFAAELETSLDTTNDGSGIFGQLGNLGSLAEGTFGSAEAASLTLNFPAPNQWNSSIQLIANEAGTRWNDVEVEFVDTLAGNVANVNWVGQRLQVEIDASQTTANTVIDALVADGTFFAKRDRSLDPSNDGTGRVGVTTGVTQGGMPERLTGRDVHPRENESVFDTLLRLGKATRDGDLETMQRLSQRIESDLDRLIFGQALMGAQNQSLDTMTRVHEDHRLVLENALSKEIDTDLAQAISELTQRQASFDALLQTIVSTYERSLWDFV